MEQQEEDEQPTTSKAVAIAKKEPSSKVSTISKKQKLEPRPSSRSDMDSSEEYEDSGNESSGEDVEFVDERDGRSNEHTSDDDYPFVVLSTEAIVQHMVDSIRDVSGIGVR